MVTVQQRGLGKGLSALISENYAAPAKAGSPEKQAERAGGSYELPIAKLYAGKFQPRNHFSEENLKELSESIAKNGIMQPIIVRPSGEYPGKYEIVAGERRWRAAKMAKLENVPVVVREIKDEQALELAIVENVQRQDLSPLEEAAGYQRLIDDFSYSQEEIATTVGKSRSHIANLLRLLGLPDKVKAMLHEGALSMGHARALLTVPNPSELATLIVKKGLNVRQAEDAARDSQGIEKQARPRAASPSTPRSSAPRTAQAPVAKDADILSLEETLSGNLGLKVSINDRGQQGEVVLAYESLTQLDEILRRLGGSI